MRTLNWRLRNGSGSRRGMRTLNWRDTPAIKHEIIVIELFIFHDQGKKDGLCAR